MEIPIQNRKFSTKKFSQCKDACDIDFILSKSNRMHPSNWLVHFF